jgi:drug/metabolite transporter, DME family
MTALPGARPAFAGAGALDVCAAAVALGSLATVSALAYRNGMTPAAFVTSRALLGAGILAAYAWLRSIPWPRDGLRSRERRMLAIAIVANGSMNLLLFAAFGVMAVALSMAVYYCYPLLVALIDVAIGRERRSARLVIALTGAVAGLVLVVGSQVGETAQPTAAGVLLAAGAAVAQAIFFVVSRDGYPSVPAEHATALILLGGALLSGVAVVVVGETRAIGAWIASPAALLLVALAGTLGAAFAKLLLLRGVRAIGSTRAALLMLIEPVAGVVIAAIVLGQAITPVQVAGGAAILAAAATVRPGRSARSPALASAIDS